MEKRQSKDEYLPDAPDGHKGQGRPQPDGISPIDPSSMPRSEDDAETRDRSPEFNDLPGAPWTPDRRG